MSTIILTDSFFQSLLGKSIKQSLPYLAKSAIKEKFSGILAGHDLAEFYIAGGSLVRWFMGKSEYDTDIDIWAGSPNSWNAVKDAFEIHLKKPENKKEVHSNNYILNIGDRAFNIQLVGKEYYKRFDLEEFDIHACQIALLGNDNVLITEQALASLVNKKITLNPTGIISANYTIKRIHKYAGLGMSLDQKTLKFILQHSDENTLKTILNTKEDY